MTHKRVLSSLLPLPINRSMQCSDGDMLLITDEVQSNSLVLQKHQEQIKSHRRNTQHSESSFRGTESCSSCLIVSPQLPLHLLRRHDDSSRMSNNYQQPAATSSAGLVLLPRADKQDQFQSPDGIHQHWTVCC